MWNGRVEEGTRGGGMRREAGEEGRERLKGGEGEMMRVEQERRR